MVCDLNQILVSKRRGIKFSPEAKISLMEGVSFDSLALPSKTNLTYVVSWS